MVMNYILMPLDAHYDSGFGAVAESFREAAITLRKAAPDPAFFGHLPQTYLFRHSVELFLKSEIIILHRKLRLPFGTHPYDGPPMISDGADWKPIHRVHSIAVLYEHWKSLINPRLDELKEMTKYKADWTINDGADQWIKVIDSVDPRSTYSRYPSVRDATEDQNKSPFKAATAEELFPEGAPEDRKIMALVIENADGEFVRAYMNEKGSKPDKEYMEALEATSEMLFNYHAMMRFELTGGF
jgi:hypothetical protein